MSVENVKAFFEKVEEDEALQDKVKKLAENRKAHDEEMASEMVKIAAAAGLDFTADDLAAARRSIAGELSEDELRTIAGGTVGYSCTGVLMKGWCETVTW
jgi:predicted ribosomally synthesized peptide with nif11-like leader